MAKRTSDVTESGAVEAPDLESAAAGAPRHGFFVRLYTGTGAFEVVGRRKLRYSISGVSLAICIASMVLRGFTFGIDFEGGTKVSMPAAGATTERVEEVFSQALGKDTETVVVVGNGPSATVQIRSEALNNDETTKLRDALFDAFQPKGLDGQPSKQAISDSAVSETWGGQITDKALLALVVFLVLAATYIAVRYERYMALSAMATLVFDLVVTAGVYSLVGFEVTPATVIGLLTILGFSLYDTVVVYDKVQENTKGLTSLNRRTYPEAANLAVNQTLMRSINTSLIALLPVAGLLVAGVVILGSGTLKDLSLVMLIGMIVGAYSSVFIAVPIAVDLKLRDPAIKAHTARVTAKRAAEGLIVDADGDPIRRIGVPSKAPRTAVAVGSGASSPATPTVPSNLK